MEMDGVVLSFSSSSSKVLASFASSSLLIGFTGLPSDGYVAGSAGDHVTNMAAGWRQVLQRYIDANFRLHAAADKILDVVAHNYDRWDEKSGAFLSSFVAANDTGEEVKGQKVSGGHESEGQKSQDIASEFLEDSEVAAPTIRMAKYHATVGRSKVKRSAEVTIPRVRRAETLPVNFWRTLKSRRQRFAWRNITQPVYKVSGGDGGVQVAHTCITSMTPASHTTCSRMCSAHLCHRGLTRSTQERTRTLTVRWQSTSSNAGLTSCTAGKSRFARFKRLHV